MPLSWAHRVGAIIWLLAPVSTLASYVVTDQPTLVLPLMIGIATAALQVDTIYAIASTVPVLAVGLPLSLEAGRLAGLSARADAASGSSR